MKNSTFGIILTIPTLLLTFFFFIVPMFNVITSSFTMDTGFSLKYYNYIFHDKEFLDALKYTTTLAVATTVASALLGLLFSFALRNTFRGRKFAIFVYQLNISIPALMVALMVLIIFSNIGFISTLLYNLSIIDAPTDFDPLSYDRYGLRIILAYIWKFFPFIGIAILSALQSTSIEYENLSKTLGVGPVRTFFHVTLPSIKTSILSTSLIVFAFCFGSYDLPSLLGGRKTLSVLAYYNFFLSSFTNSEYVAYAITSIICVIMIACSVLYFFLMVKERGRNE